MGFFWKHQLELLNGAHDLLKKATWEISTPAAVMGYFYPPCLCQPTKDLTCWTLTHFCLQLCSLANMLYGLCCKCWDQWTGWSFTTTSFWIQRKPRLRRWLPQKRCLITASGKGKTTFSAGSFSDYKWVFCMESKQKHAQLEKASRRLVKV